MLRLAARRRRSTLLAAGALLLALVAACAPVAPASPTSAPAAPKPTAPPPVASPAAAAKPATSPVAAASPAASPAAKPAASPAPSPVVAVPSPVAALEQVRVVHVPSILFAPLYVALEKGYTRDLGLDVVLDRAAAGQDAVALLANGQLDVLVGGFSAATFNAISRGLDFRVVSSMGRQPNQGYPSALMVRKDLLDSGAVREMKDLKGRKVALSGGIGATGSYWMATKLRTAGLTLRDIEVVNLGFPEMVAAFASGAIDAGFPSTPATTQIRAAGTADYFGGVTEPGASAVGTTYGGPFLKGRPDAARRLMVALVRAARDIQGPAYFAPEHLAAYEKHTATPIATLRAMDPYEFDPDLAPDEETLTDMQRVFIAEGVLTLPSPLAPDRYIDDSFVRAAVRQLGPPTH